MLGEVIADAWRALLSRRDVPSTAAESSGGRQDLHRVPRNFEQRIEALMKMPITTESCDSVLQECTRVEKANPYIPSGYKWAVEYKRFQVEISRGRLPAATKYLRSAIALVPYADDLVEQYRALVRKDASNRNIVLIVSCKKYEANAIKLARQFEEANIEFMIASGSDAPPIDYPSAIRVEASDAYEGLPRKVAAGFAWIYERIGTNVGVIKVDDDQTLLDERRFKEKVDQLRELDVYAGVPVSGVTHDRNWHWNKCHDPVLNTRSYGRPFLRPWAMGGAYYLGPLALERFVIAIARFPGYFEGEYYEDKLVGDVLMVEKVDLHVLPDYEAFGLRIDSDHRFNAVSVG